MEGFQMLDLFLKALSGLVLPAMFFLWRALSGRMDKIEKAAKDRTDEIRAEIKDDIDKLEKKHNTALSQFHESRDRELRAFYEKREKDIKELYKDFIQKDQYNASIAKNEAALNEVFEQLRDLNSAMNRLIGKGMNGEQ